MKCKGKSKYDSQKSFHVNTTISYSFTNSLEISVSGIENIYLRDLQQAKIL